MIWFLIAYGLFITGSALGIIEHGSELSLWFLFLGWLLDLTLVLLGLLGSRSVSGCQFTPAARLLHALALVGVPILLFFRLQPNLLVFKLLLALCVVAWSCSLLGIRHCNLK